MYTFYHFLLCHTILVVTLFAKYSDLKVALSDVPILGTCSTSAMNMIKLRARYPRPTTKAGIAVSVYGDLNKR